MALGAGWPPPRWPPVLLLPAPRQRAQSLERPRWGRSQSLAVVVAILALVVVALVAERSLVAAGPVRVEVEAAAPLAALGPA